MIGSLLKDELLGEFSGFFYGLHPAFILYILGTISRRDHNFSYVKTVLFLWPTCTTYCPLCCSVVEP